jgi:hydroxyisourate hydrolase
VSLSTHVLDVGAGHPAAGIPVRAERWTPEGFASVAAALTDTDGRISSLLSAGEWHAGRWQLVYEIGDYLGPDALFQTVTIELNPTTDERLHVPLLLNRYGFTIYRGS